MRTISLRDLAASAREAMGVSPDNWDCVPHCELELVTELMPVNTRLQRVQDEPPKPVKYIRRAVCSGAKRKRKVGG